MNKYRRPLHSLIHSVEATALLAEAECPQLDNPCILGVSFGNLVGVQLSRWE